MARRKIRGCARLRGVQRLGFIENFNIAQDWGRAKTQSVCCGVTRALQHGTLPHHRSSLDSERMCQTQCRGEQPLNVIDIFHVHIVPSFFCLTIPTYTHSTATFYSN
jgi:hypothetical protein